MSGAPRRRFVVVAAVAAMLATSVAAAPMHAAAQWQPATPQPMRLSEHVTPSPQQAPGDDGPWRRPERIRWLALGDSYSSGEGVLEAGSRDLPSPPPHQSDDDRCARSQFAWSQLAARWVEEASKPVAWAVISRMFRFFGIDVPTERPPIEVDMTFLACTGAIAGDGYYKVAENESLDLPEQLRRVRGQRFDLITFSFGGNDSGFGPVLRGCLNPFDTYGCNETEAQLRRRIVDQVGPTLDRAYASLGDYLMPRGQVVVVGYPRLFDEPPPTRLTCYGVLPRGDIQMIRRLGDHLERVIATTAKRHGYHFTSVKAMFEGRNACGKGGGVGAPLTLPQLTNALARWVVAQFKPERMLTPCLRIPWVNGIALGLEARSSQSFHPNLCGHIVESLAVAGGVLGLKAFAQGPIPRCPDVTFVPQSDDGAFDVKAFGVSCPQAAKILRAHRWNQRDRLDGFRCRMIKDITPPIGMSRYLNECRNGSRWIRYTTVG